MKKTGFTLVEVLMTLTIIGVVTAIVLPQFVTSAHNQAHAAKLSTLVSDYENVFGTMMLKENADSIFDTAFGQAYIGNATDVATAMDNALRRYAKTTKSSTETSDLGYIAYNKLTPFIPAALAEGSSCDENICYSPDCDGYNEAFCLNNHCQNDYHPGPEGEEGSCCPSYAGYYWDDSTGKCTPRGSCDQCRVSSCPGYYSIDCDKYRCIEAFGMFVEDANHQHTCVSPLKPLTPADAPVYSDTIMFTINNVKVTSDVFSFVIGSETASGANIFFKSPEIYKPEGSKEYRASTVFIDVNGGAAPNKFGRDVFAFVLNEDGNLLPFGSENAAMTLGLTTDNDANTWKTNNIMFGCTGNGFNGLGCTARLKENNYKVDY